MRRQLLSPVLLLTLASALPAQAPTSAAGLTRLLEAEAQRFPARVGLYVKHLGTGEEVAINAEEGFNSQSVIKLSIMIRAFQLADEGRLSLDERIEIRRANLRHGAGLLQYHDLGMRPTLRDLILQMTTVSDNIATDMVLEKVGGVAALNEWLVASGFQRTRKLNAGWEYRRKLLALLDPRFATITAEETTGLQYALSNSPLLGHYASLFTGEKAAWVETVRAPANRAKYNEVRDPLMVEDRNYWLGDMNPRETGALLEALERCTMTSRQACGTMKLFLLQQQAGARRLPHYLTVPIGHKTGDSAVISNDVGVVYARSGPIVISFFVNGIRGSLAEAEDRMGHIAKLIVDYFDGTGRTTS